MEQRLSTLRLEAGEDANLYDEVARLLQAEADAGSFLSRPAAQALFDAHQLTGFGHVLEPGDCLGAYRIVRRLDQGGVSVVYLADRWDGVFEQQVAVKVMKRGMDTASVTARFHSERQILAAFDHPFIARILDGGTTEDGLPYFVMEYVEGENLSAYLEHNELTVREKLELFVNIASAVAYAHRRQIVHRDLKPANIMVDARGMPKLLDFGLAKVLSADSDSEQTALAERMLTPAYASPEQIAGDPATTASDVYSLGVVLHEMLVGSRPCVERESRLPSADSAAPRDVTSIVRMALHEEPVRRYRSADQLREDVERHLVGLPVEARHATTTYRLWRFIGRHRIGLSVACAMAMILTSSGSAVLWQREVARSERTRAERRYQEVRELANLLLGEVDDALVDIPGSPPVRRALVTNALNYLVALESESSGDPLLQREIARAYLRLGDVRRQSYGLSGGDTAGALANFERSLEVATSLVEDSAFVKDDLETLARCHQRIALTLRQMGEWQRELEHARMAVEIHREVIAMSPGLRTTLSIHADMLQTLGHSLCRAGAEEKMLETFQRVVELRQRVFDLDPTVERARADLAGALRNLGLGHQLLGHLEASQGVHAKALQHAQVLLEQKPTSLSFRNDLVRNHQQLGKVLCARGDVATGLAHLHAAASLGRTLQQTAPNNATVRRRLAQTYRDLGLSLINAGSLDEGVETLTRAVELLDPWVRAYAANAEVQVLLAEVRTALGRAYELSAIGSLQPQAWQCALASYRQGMALWGRLESEGHLVPLYQREPERLLDAIGRCEAELLSKRSVQPVDVECAAVPL